ncbi:hypothetical protein HOO65_020167 [Ceratocystis lukuohia]|uniref:Uncharacterized protein n=1 Tax=Ceratocystis lukuohia TaxID=2019550 RepID=A0ABR4MN10_9PEZI
MASVKTSVSSCAAPLALSEAEKHQFQQYKKIIALRDVVLSGGHPRIKIPARLVGKVPPPHAVTSPVLLLSRPGPSARGSAASATLNTDSAAASSATSSSAPDFKTSPGTAKPAVTSEPSNTVKSNVEINPVLLQKSDDLIRAEFRVRRQRIENSLQEELETKRLANKASIYPEPELNIAKIYETAQKLVAAADASTTANVVSTSSHSVPDPAPVPIPDVDSLSNASYYSSRHDTPISQDDQPMSIDDAASVGDPTRTDGHNTAPSNAPASVPDPTAVSCSSLATVAPVVPPAAAAISAAIATASVATLDSTTAQPPTATSNFSPLHPITRSAVDYSHSPRERQVEIDSALDSDSAPAVPSGPMQYQRTRRVYESEQPPPSIFRSHNLVPAAPQPYHVSSLATRDGVQAVEASIVSPTERVASHKDVSSGSTGTSPKDRGKQRKNKGKKRKQDRTDEPATVVKTEPKSPEMKAPEYAPRKRQKGKRVYASADEDSVQYSPGGSLTADPRDHPYHRAPGHYVSYGDHEPYRRRVAEPAHERVYIEPGPSSSRPPHYVRPAYNLYSTEERYPTERSASRYYHESHEPGPASVAIRHEFEHRATSPAIADSEPAAMGSVRASSGVVVVDDYGRSYYEPSRPSYPRQPHYGEELVYKRAVSRRPGPAEYYDDDPVYRRASPVAFGTYPRRATSPTPFGAYAPRHVVTQSEVLDSEMRPREYSVRPVGPPVDDYVSVRPTPTDRRGYDEPATYSRPISVRPPLDGSFAPTMPPHSHPLGNSEFHRTASVRPPDSGDLPPPMPPQRHFMPPPSTARAYSVVPAERMQRNYSVHPEVEHRYYTNEIEYVGRAPNGAYAERAYRR